VKTSFKLAKPAAVILLTAGAFIVNTSAQAPESAQRAIANELRSPRTFPRPRNLTVLPKSLSGQQVREIMVQWGFSLGVRCDSCHAQATERSVADDDSNLNFADDSKPMKAAARTMYLMTEEINATFVGKMEGSGLPVTCGTCHRGRVGTEPFDQFEVPTD